MLCLLRMTHMEQLYGEFLYANIDAHIMGVCVCVCVYYTGQVLQSEHEEALRQGRRGPGPGKNRSTREICAPSLLVPSKPPFKREIFPIVCANRKPRDERSLAAETGGRQSQSHPALSQEVTVRLPRISLSLI